MFRKSTSPAPVLAPLSAPAHMVALGALSDKAESDKEAAARNDKRVFLVSVALVFAVVFVAVSAFIF